jgi:pseudouridine kinase
MDQVEKNTLLDILGKEPHFTESHEMNELKRKPDILCIGGANVDRKIQSINDLVLGTSNPAKSVVTCGGVARNIAENLGRLGYNPSLLSFMGNDPEGKWIVNQSKEFVNFAPSEILEGQLTGSYTAVLDADGEMAVALADMEIYENVNTALIDRKWPFISQAEFILLDTNFPAAVLEKIILYCKTEQIPLCIAPVSAPKIKRLPACLKGVEWVITNKSEAEALSGVNILSEGDFFKAAEAILAKGAERTVITRGDKGLIYFTRNGEAGVLHSPSVPVMDVTGAGDALIAGILYAFIKGIDMENCCKIGAACSIITLQSIETVSSKLTSHELQETFRKFFSKGVIKH